MVYAKQITLFSVFLLFVFVPYITVAGKPLESKTIPLKKEITTEKQIDMQEMITELVNKIENGELDLQNYEDVQKAVAINYESLDASKTVVTKKMAMLMFPLVIFFVMVLVTLASVKIILW